MSKKLGCDSHIYKTIEIYTGKNHWWGFKAFHAGQATLAGIELHRMLRKGQHKDAARISVFEQFYA